MSIWRDRGALAGMDVLGGQDDIELAVLFDDVALAKRTGDDFHELYFLLLGPSSGQDVANDGEPGAPDQTPATVSAPQHTDFAAWIASILLASGRPADGRTSRCRRLPWWTPDVHADRRPFLLAADRNHRRRSGRFSPSRTSSRSRPRSCRSRPATRPICTPSRPRLMAPDGARASRSICTPRRSSPARSCWRPARPRLFNFARVFRNRERGAAAPSRIHHARMVPGGRALRGDDGRLRRAAGPRGRGGRDARASPSAAASADPFARAGAR